MKVKKSKLFKLLIVFLFLLLIMFQSLAIKRLFNENKTLKTKIIQQLEINERTKQEYKNNKTKIQIETKAKTVKNLNHNNLTAEILNHLEKLNLVLIDYSNNQGNLNININGDFHSILNLFNYLENEKFVKIMEFKLKNNQENLFLFIKIKNELI